MGEWDPAVTLQDRSILGYVDKSPAYAVSTCLLKDRVQGRETLWEPECRVDLGNAARTELGKWPGGVVAPVDRGGRCQGGKKCKLVAEAECQITPARMVLLLEKLDDTFHIHGTWLERNENGERRHDEGRNCQSDVDFTGGCPGISSTGKNDEPP